MIVIKNGQVVASPTPVIALEQWLDSPDQDTGVLLPPDQSAKQLQEHLEKLPVIAIEFPVFSDGRGFSLARQLREQFGYQGEIRAVGHLIRDQYLFLHRCGFNAVEVSDESSLPGWQAAMNEISIFYQNTVDQRLRVSDLRVQPQAAQ